MEVKLGDLYCNPFTAEVMRVRDLTESKITFEVVNEGVLKRKDRAVKPLVRPSKDIPPMGLEMFQSLLRRGLLMTGDWLRVN